MDQKTETRSYIKRRIRLNKDSKQIFNELCGINGPRTISMRTVFRWVKAFKAGKVSVEDDTRPGRPRCSHICTDQFQFTCYIGTWTRRLKFVAMLNVALGLI